jgi:two-component system, NarL family, sensor histidine kinase UhpB
MPELARLARSSLSAEANPAAGDSQPEQRTRRRYLTLFQRVAALNALLLVLAVALTIAVLDPSKVSSFEIDAEAGSLVAVLLLVVGLNLYLIRRVVRPLEALTSLAQRVDLVNPGERLPDAEPTSEAGELALTFNEMLDRLAAERREATGRVLEAQEAERLRIARELHDQVGQELTAVLLLLSRFGAQVPPELQPDVCELQGAVRASLEEVRQIAVQLRPEALDDLGLVSALTVLCRRFGERTGLDVRQRIEQRLPALTPESELVVYRVAQEALTNVARHSGADRVELKLGARDGRLVLSVRDHGRGLADVQRPGGGIRGMRERAALVGGRLAVTSDVDGAGCEVRLEVPASESR